MMALCAKGFRLNILQKCLTKKFGHAFDKTQDLSAFSFHPLLVSIEGNIGAGKSTLLKKLRSTHPEWTFIEEPISAWFSICNENGDNILEAFYKDRKRWSYTFQNCALLTRYQYIEEAITKHRENIVNKHSKSTHIFLTERCLDTDYHVFTKMLHAEGSINSMEMQLYEKLLRQLQSTSTKLAAIIHVNTPPALCVERIKLRGRNGEDSISLDYLHSLDKFQNQWIENTSIPTCATDGSNFEEVERFLMQLQSTAEDAFSAIETDGPVVAPRPFGSKR